MAVLVGKPAPDFTATAVMGNNEIKDITLSSFTKGKYTVIFFYPFDFTFVCPTELIAFDHRLEEFRKRNVEVIGVSIDSEHTHLAWKNTAVDKGGHRSGALPDRGGRAASHRARVRRRVGRRRWPSAAHS